MEHHENEEPVELYINESIVDGFNGNGRDEIISLARCLLPQIDQSVTCEGCLRDPSEYINMLSHAIYNSWYELKAEKEGSELHYTKCGPECKGCMQPHYFITLLLVRDPAFDGYTFLHNRERMDAAFLEEIYGKIELHELGGDLVPVLRSHFEQN